MKDRILYPNNMGDSSTEIKLFSQWSSYYSKRVELALRLKGIPYEYIEQDLQNKSELLLHYNPVHKKVPVLVHNGKPITESLVILEYIDETWKSGPQILPDDPYERAKARFWANFYDQKLIPSSVAVLMFEGEKQEKAIEELSKNVSVLEEGLSKDFPAGNNCTYFFNGGKTMGYLDIIISMTSCTYRASEEAVGDNKFLDSKKHPLIVSWLNTLSEHPVVKETLPPHDKLVEAIKMLREKFTKVSTD